MSLNNFCRFAHIDCCEWANFNQACFGQNSAQQVWRQWQGQDETHQPKKAASACISSCVYHTGFIEFMFFLCQLSLIIFRCPPTQPQ